MFAFVSSAVLILCSIIGTVLVSKIGRRTMIITGLVVSAIANLGLALSSQVYIIAICAE